MDTFAALALATEPPGERLMDQPPQGRSEPLITPIMYKNMIGHALWQMAVLLWMTRVPSSLSWWGLPTNESVLGSAEHDTIVFNTFVIMQIFNIFNCRSVHDEFNIFEDFHRSIVAQVRVRAARHAPRRRRKEKTPGARTHAASLTRLPAPPRSTPVSPFSRAALAQFIIFVIVAMQYLIVQFGGPVMQTTPLTMDQWKMCTFIGLLSIPVGYVLKLIPAGVKQLSGGIVHDKLAEVTSHETRDNEGEVLRAQAPKGGAPSPGGAGATARGSSRGKARKNA